MTANKPQQSAVDRVTSIFTAKHGFSRDIALRARDQFGDKWERAFAETIDTLYSDEPALEAAISGYAAFAMDSMRRQKKFELTRKYEQKTYAETSRVVYFNEQHMLDQYLPGLLLSHYLWPHQYRQLRFFRNNFVASMKKGKGVRYIFEKNVPDPFSFAEVGIGTGLYSRIILQDIPEISGTGFDISQHSKAFTENHLRAFGVYNRYTIRLEDVRDNTPQNEFQWLVCVEVLEHLEDPASFLETLRKMLAPGGKAFITAALNAADEDHIYLYENTAQIIEQLTAAGFFVEQSFYNAAYLPASAGMPVPAVAAFIVS